MRARPHVKLEPDAGATLVLSRQACQALAALLVHELEVTRGDSMLRLVVGEYRSRLVSCKPRGGG